MKDYTKPGLATTEEIKRNTKEICLSDTDIHEDRESGIPVWSDGDYMRIAEEDSHTLVVGDSGSKKTRCVVMPYSLNCAKAGDMMIISDVKGEMLSTLGAFFQQSGYEIYVMDFDHPETSLRYNPLEPVETLYRNGETAFAEQLLNDIAAIIFGASVHSEKDPFWENTAKELFVGLAYYILESSDRTPLSLTGIMKLYHTIANNNSFPSGFKGILEYGGKQYEKVLFNMNAWMTSAKETRASINSVFSTAMSKLIGIEEIKKMLSETDFDFTEVAQKKSVIFLKSNEITLTTAAPIISAFVRLWYGLLIRLSNRNKGKLARKVTFILDEFGNLPPIEGFNQQISLSRSRRICWLLVLQSFSQLTHQYGKACAEIIISNTPNWIYLHSPEQKLLETLSEIAGETEDDGHTRKVITPTQLRQFVKFNSLDMTQALIIAGRMRPIITYFPDISVYKCLRECNGKSKKVKRKKTENRFVLDTKSTFQSVSSY